MTPRQSLTLQVTRLALDQPDPTPELKLALQDWLTMTQHPDRLRERDPKLDNEFQRRRSRLLRPHDRR